MPVANANGKKFNFPEGTTPDQMGVAIDEFFAGSVQPQKEARSNPVLNTVREGLQGLTLGLSDEIGAAVATLPAAGNDFLNGRGFEPGRVFNEIRGDIRREQEAFRRDEPVLSTAAQLVGGIATGGAGLAKTAGATAGKSALKRVGGAAGVGAAEGGVAGAAFAEGEDRLQSGIIGAATGAVLNTAGSEAINAGQKFFKKRSEIKEAAEKVLNNRNAGISDGGETVAAGFKLDTTGKAIPDPIQREAIKQGLDEGTVSLIKSMSNASRRKSLQMLNTLEKRSDNKRFSALNRTEDALGQSVETRLKDVMRANRRAGARIGQEGRKLSGQQADFTDTIQTFRDDLDGIGITLKPSKDGKSIVPDFTDSDIEFNSASKKALKNIIKRMPRVGDAQEAHKLKRTIDDMVTFGKVKKGLSGSGERVLKQLRRNIDQTLDANFPEYKAANDLYAKTIGAIDNLQSSAGSKIDLTGDNADKALGRLATGILSNNRGRQELINSLDELDKVAKGLSSEDLGLTTPRIGGAFNDDLVDLAVFSDELQKLFGPEASKSLAGETAKGVKSGLRAAVGDTGELLNEGLQRVADVATGVNKAEGIKAIRALLKDSI